MNVLDKFKHFNDGTIMVIGQSDTGKTTLIMQILAGMPTIENIAIVDLDTGQSTIGPPTTLAWCFAHEYLHEKNNMAKYFFFAGYTSPVGNAGRHLVGSKIVTDSARKNARVVIIDTSGLVAAPYGTTLKLLKIRLLKPDVLIALENANELEEIKIALRKQSTPELINIPTDEKITTRSAERRAAYRKKIFKDYFSNAGKISITLDSAGLYDTFLKRKESPIYNRPSNWFANRLVGLEDHTGKCLDLGLIVSEKINAFKSIEILTPLSKSSEIANIAFGQIKLSPYGDQLSEEQSYYI